MRIRLAIARCYLPFGLSIGLAAQAVTDPGKADDLPEMKFDVVDVDSKVGVGYGLATAEINGDGKPDIVLVDRDLVAWYENPGASGEWQKHVIARRLTRRDHVCIAVRDIDGDGKAEIAVGAGWNPGDTINSGSVHYLVAPADRTQPWRPIPLPHEPTVHRMRWLKDAQGYGLLVAPLHGRGNRGGRGVGVKLLIYRPPAKMEGPWEAEVVDDSLHVTHNVDPVQWDQDSGEEVVVASREGLFLFDRSEAGWKKTQLARPQEGDSFRGAGEIRVGRADGQKFLAAVEPFHGNQLVVYQPAKAGSPRRFWRRQVLASDMSQGHALACGDILGLGVDQIVVGWRNKNAAGKVGLRLHIPNGSEWTHSSIDDGGMACEDLRLADLDGDGKLDIVAAGRSTHNLRIYFNRTSR